MTAVQSRAQRARVSRALTPRRALGICVALCVCAAMILGFRGAESLRSLEAGFNDRLRVILSPLSEAQDPRISVLTITEDTLALFPYRSPVDRAFLAQVIDVLGRSGAKAVGLDILVDQPTEPAKDAALVEAIRRFEGPVVVAYADERAGLRPAQQAHLAQFVEASGAVPGFATVRYDPDGVVRRFAAEPDPGRPLAFPAALLGAAGGAPEPAEGLIDWRRETAEGSPAFQTIPSQAVLNPALPEAMFRVWFGGRFVMIGADLEQTDRHQTSLAVDPTISNRTNPGVLLHAHVLSQMLDRRAVDDWSVDGWRGALAVALMAGLGTALGLAGLPLWWKLGGLALSGAAYAGLAVALAAGGGPYLPVAPSLLGLGIAFGLGGASEAFLSGREKAFIRQAFSHYLEPAMVDRLARDRTRLRLGGERREISFIFTDVAGFTDMSERLEPEVLSELLNGYFDGMSDIIAAHGGVIDKFIGDAVVALFGALGQGGNHALAAIRCAAEMDGFAEAYRRRMGPLGLGVTRIGVHTGVASVGNFGGRKRFDYTAMGDAMNTAARLEGINKRLGTRVTISGAAKDAAGPGAPELRPVGRVMLKGKAEAVEVWSLDRETPAPARAAYAEAFALIEAAPAAARELLAPLAPSDPLAALHLARLEQGERGDRID